MAESSPLFGELAERIINVFNATQVIARAIGRPDDPKLAPGSLQDSSPYVIALKQVWNLLLPSGSSIPVWPEPGSSPQGGP